MTGESAVTERRRRSCCCCCYFALSLSLSLSWEKASIYICVSRAREVIVLLASSYGVAFFFLTRHCALRGADYRVARSLARVSFLTRVPRMGIKVNLFLLYARVHSSRIYSIESREQFFFCARVFAFVGARGFVRGGKLYNSDGCAYTRTRELREEFSLLQRSQGEREREREILLLPVRMY